MRIAAVGLFFVTFAVTTWAIRIPGPTVPPGAVAEPTPPVAAETARTPSAGNPVAEGGTSARPQFQFPPGSKAVGVRAVVSDEVGGRLTLGTKVDLHRLPGGQVSVGPPELVLSGVFVIPTSTVSTLSGANADAEGESTVCLALTTEQTERLVVAEQRGKLQIVPAK